MKIPQKLKPFTEKKPTVHLLIFSKFFKFQPNFTAFSPPSSFFFPEIAKRWIFFVFSSSVFSFVCLLSWTHLLKKPSPYLLISSKSNEIAFEIWWPKWLIMQNFGQIFKRFAFFKGKKRLISEKFCYKARGTLKILKKLVILWNLSLKNWPKIGQILQTLFAKIPWKHWKFWWRKSTFRFSQGKIGQFSKLFAKIIVRLTRERKTERRQKSGFSMSLKGEKKISLIFPAQSFYFRNWKKLKKKKEKIYWKKAQSI